MDLDFGTLTTTQTGPALQVGYAVTQSLNKTTVVGTNVVTYTGFLRGIITGIGKNEVYVKITDRVDDSGVSYPVSYKNPEMHQQMPTHFLLILLEDLQQYLLVLAMELLLHLFLIWSW